MDLEWNLMGFYCCRFGISSASFCLNREGQDWESRFLDCFDCAKYSQVLHRLGCDVAIQNGTDISA